MTPTVRESGVSGMLSTPLHSTVSVHFMNAPFWSTIYESLPEILLNHTKIACTVSQLTLNIFLKKVIISAEHSFGFDIFFITRHCSFKSSKDRNIERLDGEEKKWKEIEENGIILVEKTK